MGKSLVLGFFDGVHKAHKAVINSALEFSDDVTLITFKESPAVFFDNKAEYILSRQNSIHKIERLGIKDIKILDFPKIANLSAENYLKYLIDSFHPISISTGFNHTFGLNKLGNTDFLREHEKAYNYKYICVPPVKDNHDVISSTLIKNLLKEGNVTKANSLLESNFILEGKVIHGAKIGRTIGFPTANINYPNKIVKIPYGVYAVKINDKIGVMNWGIKPTVNNTKAPIVEVHILDFNGDLYGKNIKLEVINQIRGEKKFENINTLKQQIQKDVEECLKL